MAQHSPLLKQLAIRWLGRSGRIDRLIAERRRVRRWRDGARADLTRGSFERSVGHLHGEVVVRRQHGWAVAERRDHLVVADLMAENLSLAVDLVTRVGVPYFVVSSDTPRFHRIGVEDVHRAQLFAALADTGWGPSVFAVASRAPGTVLPARSVAGREPELQTARVWAIGRMVTDRAAARAYGDEYACEIEFWTPDEPDGPPDPDRPPDAIFGARRNPVAAVLPRAGLFDDRVEIAGRSWVAPSAMAAHHRSQRLVGQVDVVYTWVDDRDEYWRSRRDAHLLADGAHGSFDGISASRFTNRDELRYSLRSLHQFADFAGHVYLVTDGQTPEWLDPVADGITVVDHRSIFGPDDRLPVFNSHAIESRLHRIPGLSERYLYMNDDVFFGRRVEASTFFDRNGRSRYFLSRARIPAGPSRPDEPSVSSAAKNGRDLVVAATGYFPTQKVKHTPHAQRLSTFAAIEDRFPDLVERLGSSRFRSVDDVSLASSFHHHFGHAIGAALPADLRYQYVNLSTRNLPSYLDGLLDELYDTFCLNDVAVAPADDERISSELQHFFRRKFPFPAPWERA